MMGARAAMAPGAQVVAVAEAARQDHKVDVVQGRICMPGVAGVHADHVAEDVQRIGVAIAAGKDDDGGVHAGCATFPSTGARASIANDSITGLTSNWRHMASARSAAAASLAGRKLNVDELADADVVHLGEAQIVEAAADGQTLRIVDAGVELDSHSYPESLAGHPASSSWASR